MCGIIGYIGNQQAVPILIEGLKRLEYRGYDSAGIACYDTEKGEIVRIRAVGKISELEKKLRDTVIRASTGIGHTRWATHGAPSENNAHPHKSGPFVVVHNGIVENYRELRSKLTQEGYQFTSDTDTEVIVKLMEYLWNENKNEWKAFQKTIQNIRGTFAIAIICEHLPDRIFVARYESPLVIGVGEEGYYVASDIPALLPFTQKIIYLNDKEMALIKKDNLEIYNFNGEELEPKIELITWSPTLAEKGGYRHFMQKEIFEQPRAISDTIKPYLNVEKGIVSLPYASALENVFNTIERIIFVACGTSYHAGLVGKYLFEAFLGLPCEADIASEFRYRPSILTPRTLVVAISQSGETADTKGAIKVAKEMGAPTCSIVNVLGSSLSRMTDSVIYTHAGPEIGVASTKAFTSQLAALVLMALLGIQIREGKTSDEEFISALLEIPHKASKILDSSSQLEKWARPISKAQTVIYLGRNLLYAVALEGALKLKEISYIHAEGYAAGEMKHGPIALIDERVPVVCLTQRGFFFEKMKANIEEVRARGGKVYLVADELLRKEVSELAHELFFVPSTHDLLIPFLFIIPMQLLAYYVAVEKGTDVDQPRNLAKSVTVE
ncbi:MAG: glutamine--fructose-6-phosphate transaminase (isomerizing) [Syntrophobacterales bacterium]|nr:glutamine--fructose-6-phosphate transaminase (isomerizing) [Syntrophobacterales bacterium]